MRVGSSACRDARQRGAFPERSGIIGCVVRRVARQGEFPFPETTQRHGKFRLPRRSAERDFLPGTERDQPKIGLPSRLAEREREFRPLPRQRTDVRSGSQQLSSRSVEVFPREAPDFEIGYDLPQTARSLLFIPRMLPLKSVLLSERVPCSVRRGLNGAGITD